MYNSLQESRVLPINFSFSLPHKHPASVQQFNGLLIYFSHASSDFPEKYFAHQTKMPSLAFFPLH